MDVCGLFIGDTSMSYGSIRSVLYRDYEKFPYGTFESNKNPNVKDYYSKAQEKCQQINALKKSKQSCPFCKENKKRPLVNYMRKREVQKHKDSICEEDEEELEEQFEEEEEDHSGHEHAEHEHSAHEMKKTEQKSCNVESENVGCEKK